jgi:hypothetical protein
MPEFSATMARFTQYFLNPVLALVFAAGLLWFAIGIVAYLIGLSRGDLDAREWGRRHLLYGLIGLFVMFTSWSLLTLIAKTVGYTGTIF